MDETATVPSRFARDGNADRDRRRRHSSASGSRSGALVIRQVKPSTALPIE